MEFSALETFHCNEHYIGETSQPLKKRLQQLSRSSSGPAESAVFAHRRASGHEFDFDEVKILERESRWFERVVKESIWGLNNLPSSAGEGSDTIYLTLGTEL